MGSSMSSSMVLKIALVMTAAVWGTAVIGQEKPGTREREALRRSQQQLQQIRQEKVSVEEKLATVEKEKAGLSDEKEKLAKQVGGALTQAKSESIKSQKLQTALDAEVIDKKNLEMQKADLDKRLAELSTKLAGTEKALTQSQAEKSRALSTVDARDAQVASCESKNVKLYQHGRDLIAQCRDRSATDSVLRLERFTGIKRVEIENLLEEYRDRLDVQRVMGGTDPN
jgi:chromosome segregation ATPase